MASRESAENAKRFRELLKDPRAKAHLFECLESEFTLRLDKLLESDTINDIRGAVSELKAIKLLMSEFL